MTDEADLERVLATPLASGIRDVLDTAIDPESTDDESRLALTLALVDAVEPLVAQAERAVEAHAAAVVRQREREATEAGAMGVLELLAGICDALDALTIELADTSHAMPLRILSSRFDRVFAAHRFERIQAVGQVFDATCHESVGETAGGEHAAGTVVEEVGRGYRRDELVLRPARVIIAAAADEVGDQ